MRMKTDQPTKYQVVVHTQSLYRFLNVFILYLKKNLNSKLKKTRIQSYTEHNNKRKKNTYTHTNKKHVTKRYTLYSIYTENEKKKILIFIQ